MCRFGQVTKMSRSRLAGSCGLLGIILVFSCILSAIASFSQFSWLNNALSDLGVQSGITPFLFNGGLVLSGFLFIVFAFGLDTTVGKSFMAKFGVILFILACASLVSIGLFNENFRPTHYLASVAFFVLLPVSMFVIMVSLWLSRKRLLGAFTLAIGLIAAAPWVLQFSLNYVPNVAIPEFLSGLSGAVWAGYLSLRMLRDYSVRAK
jgi:hypothetical membrane protein